MDNTTCLCGHDITEHHYSPSGCGGSHCEWSESLDKYGFPAGKTCNCQEYLTPEDEQ